jgi:serine protease Do
VLKIRGRGLPAAQLGSSRSLPIGAWVAALGRTADGQGSAAVGVLSARDREILTRDDRLYMSLLQTDAAINPENSGGPLVGPGGEVVGISTAIVPPAYAQGISFAIASEVASRVAADLVRYGRMRLAWLGIQYEDLADQSRGRLRVEDTRGIVVKKVLPGTPAARAGLRQDDVIVGFDQFPIRAKKDFRWRIVQARPGQKITLKVLRRGQPLSLYATLSEASED